MDYLDSLFNRALDAVVGMDTSGNISAWNTAAEKIFGWSQNEAIGSSLGNLIVPLQHRCAHARGLDHYNRTGEGPVLEQHVHITALHRNGSEFPVELSIFPMDSPDRPPMFYAFIRSLAFEESVCREQNLRTREAEAILKIGEKLIEDVTLDEFTQFCLNEVCEIAELDAAHLFVIRGKGTSQFLVPSGIWHLRCEQFRPVIEATSPLRFGLGDGLPGKALMTGKMEVIDDLVSDCNFVRRDVFGEVGLTRGVALPVRHGGKIHAVLEFFGTQNARLDPDILRLLRTVGSQIGAAIRRKEGAESREILRREMMHRVGNSLAVLSSIYRSCSRNAVSKEDLDETFLNRLVAMGRANRMAIVESERGIPLPKLIIASLGILPDHDCIEIDVPPIMIGSETVMPLSLVFNELATNALKYGALGSESRLYIKTLTSYESDHLEISWKEIYHKPRDTPPEQPIRVGFGTQLIRAMIEGKLSGSYERCLDLTGFHFHMRMPRCQVDANPEAPYQTT